ncbi:hypothetical protein ACHAL6_00445 [Proteiniclasticum sp. C24MP]|uniref:hypothetical protein n=1 Tax=Proteiniclasticum sp. C24MP TaxID=3374101 RepID=UPI003754514E
MKNTRNIELERRFLQNHFPEMADRTAKASDEVIAIAYDTLQLDDEELDEFIEYLKAKSK